jgi:hypothetical protein
MRLSRARLAAAASSVLVVACLSAAFLSLLPRLRLGGAIEGVQWVQAAGSMFWALPLTFVVLVGAGSGYAIARVRELGRWGTAVTVGVGAVAGAAAFVAVGTPWYEAADGIAPSSLGLAVATFVVAASGYLVAGVRRKRS